MGQVGGAGGHWMWEGLKGAVVLRRRDCLGGGRAQGRSLRQALQRRVGGGQSLWEEGRAGLDE